MNHPNPSKPKLNNNILALLKKLTCHQSKKYGEEKNTMCEANAYLIQGDEKKLVMEAVDTVEPEGDGIRLVSIFGDQKFIKAHIHSLALVDHNIFLKE